MSVRIKPNDVCFLIFAHRSPCQQCHDYVAVPDVGRSAAGVGFLLYHSNFIAHRLELKAHKNGRHHLVRLFQLVTKASHHLYTAQPHIGDCAHLPYLPKLVANLYDEAHMALTLDKFHRHKTLKIIYH